MGTQWSNIGIIQLPEGGIFLWKDMFFFFCGVLWRESAKVKPVTEKLYVVMVEPSTRLRGRVQQAFPQKTVSPWEPAVLNFGSINGVIVASSKSAMFQGCLMFPPFCLCFWLYGVIKVHSPFRLILKCDNSMCRTSGNFAAPSGGRDKWTITSNHGAAWWQGPQISHAWTLVVRG